MGRTLLTGFAGGLSFGMGLVGIVFGQWGVVVTLAVIGLILFGIALFALPRVEREFYQRGVDRMFGAIDARLTGARPPVIQEQLLAVWEQVRNEG